MAKPAHSAPPSVATLTDFKDYAMAHPRLQGLHDQVARAIREPGGVSLLFIIGPTGVGKTTLIARLMRQLTCEQQGELTQERERLAVAGMEAEAPPLGNYDFKQHFKRSLQALGEILIEQRVDVQRPKRETPSSAGLIVNSTTTAAVLRGALESALKRRRPAAFFIDEAHHLSKVTAMRKLQDHLDVIKSLANVTETLHVLVGTYELQALLNLSDQLSRRSRTFHFERYHSGQATDVQVFQNILWNFQTRLPFPQPPDLRAHSEYLMERSLGCVGILKGWLLRATALALEERAATLTLRQLERQAPTNAEWRSMATAMLEGEEALRDAKVEVESLRLRLQAQPAAKTSQARPSELAAVASTAKSSRSRHTRRPGERYPARDPVGKA